MESEHDPSGREVLGDKSFRYSMPVEVLYPALTEGRSAWLRLQPGEVEPQVLEAVPGERVVWSSFWPASPDDIIELVLSHANARMTARMAGVTGSALRVRWLSNSPPDDRGIGVTRWRLSRKFGGDLRRVEGQYYGPKFWEWERQQPRPPGNTNSSDMTVRLVYKVRWIGTPDDQK